METTHRLIVDPEETLSSSFFATLVLQIPNSIPVGEFIVLGTTLKYSNSF